MDEPARKPSVLGGTMIIAGTAIGAGMLALPMISAGMWLYWSVVVTAGTWLFLTLSSQMLLEVNLHFPRGASFHSMTEDLLGRAMSAVNGLSVAFVLYIVVYAYISGGGSILRQVGQVAFDVALPKPLLSLVFALFMTVCVACGAWLVDRLSVLMMGGMALAFVLSMSGILSEVRLDTLLDREGGGGQTLFIWGALSTYLTSFCFPASMPSLVKYFGPNPKAINRSLLLGSVLVLVWYLVWIISCDGAIPRQDFKGIIAAGGNVGDLVRAAGSNLDSTFIEHMLESFAFLAVATSFLGAGLGLFDYLADFFGFDDTCSGRAKTTLVTFVPPMSGAIFWPDGFLLAVGWAGLAATIWAVIVPALMLRAARKKYSTSLFRAPGGSGVVGLLLAYGALIAVCHTLFVFNLLPMYQ